MPKYQLFPTIDLPNRQWPNRQITSPPQWCSVDLRDGNQALAQPMSVEEKLEYFAMLLKIGFKQIEVGFPAASQIEFDFCRRLIEDRRIPNDVWIQILCQCREDLIGRSLEALRGAKNIIFHLYNSTSPKQRQYVFNADKPAVKKIATDAIEFLKTNMQPLLSGGSQIQLQYSPESFNSTELDFALEICEAVTDIWQPSPSNKIIINLPATVEYSTPNVHADQIEWMCSHLSRRQETVVSLHTHNDRGTGVAATELSLMAGADRVEGTLFGIGERTGNLDIVTVALNMQSQGIETGLDFSDLPGIREVYERITRMTVPARQPYAGDLAFTAFSGSHQDAIKKSWAQQKPGQPWDVLYIPIDPADIGRTYEAIIRINSQSGKGGVAWVLQDYYGLDLPKNFQKDFGRAVNNLADTVGTELSSTKIWNLFESTYLQHKAPWTLLNFHEDSAVGNANSTTIKAKIATPVGVEKLKSSGSGPINAFYKGLASFMATINWPLGSHKIKASGHGPIEAFSKALLDQGAPLFEIIEFHESSMTQGAQSQAAAFVCLQIAGQTVWGCAIHASITVAGLEAVLNALNRFSLQTQTKSNTAAVNSGQDQSPTKSL